MVQQQQQQGISQSLFGWLPGWVGFVFGLAVGVIAVIVGFATSDAGFVAFGLWAVTAIVIAFVAGATAEPRINPFKKSFGAVVENVPMVPWLIIAGLFVVALVVAFVS